MRLKAVLLLSLGLAGFTAYAEDMMDINANASEREPAAVSSTLSAKRTYPGGQDDEDLQVQNHIPDAAIKTDARSVQRGVFKTLYNQELKDERTENVEE